MCSVVILIVASLTWAWWDKGIEVQPTDLQLHDWQLVYAKIAPCILFTQFTVFNVWIQCSNKRISRDIIMPWVSCRCSLYTFLFVLPTLISIAELIGVCQYKNFWRKKAFYNGYYGLFACAMLIATWFQITIVKWCLFVRKAVMIRERRV